MPGRMLVLRAITAANMTTAHTQAQMYPAIAHFEARFAADTAWRYDIDLPEMLAGSHRCLILH